ncbi:MAG TPA: glycerophosphodiester phosphodiesterase family protein [Bryobacteraceae bacterium]|nr:glycerophosphodiester phosphodiesterase family protein [Bryobacteraceae bacterium]
MLRIACLGFSVLAVVAAGAQRTIQVQGEMGAAGMFPGNTPPSFESAISAGADAIEMDMQVTKDNVIVISHDPILHAPYCSGPKPDAVIHELTLAEIRKWDCGSTPTPGFPRQQTVPGTRMPTLDEVFALAPRGKFLFNIETKIIPARLTIEQARSLVLSVAQVKLSGEALDLHARALMLEGPEMTPPPEEFARMVLDEIRKHHLESRVILESFDFRTLRAMKKLEPRIQLSALCMGPDLDFVKIGKESGAGIISPLFNFVSAEQVRAAHAAGLQVLPWVANEPADWDRLIAAGVDSILTDYPADLVAYLRNKTPR